MRFNIAGRSYDAYESVTHASLGDLRALNKHGVNIPTINATFAKFGTTSTTNLLADDDFIDNMIGLIWLARRKAGEDLTYEQAADVSFMDITFEDDEDDTPDPKALSVPVEDQAEPILTP